MWSSPPDRRELSLVLFAVTVFILSYNLDTSFRLLGLDPVATQFRSMGLGGKSVLDDDGRRVAAWRDKAEKYIVGDWKWDAGEVAGDGAERKQPKGSDRYGSQWVGREDIGGFVADIYGADTVDKAMQWWGTSLPETVVLKHAPGYTILDKVYLFDNKAYLVTDTPASMPDVASIAQWTANSKDTKQITSWHTISTKDAHALLGDHGGRIHGVTWLSTDTSIHNATLLSLWRTYSTLDPVITTSGHTVLPPPQRLIFPHIKAFADDPPVLGEFKIRVRSPNGINPRTLQGAFPHLGIMYKEDWQDFMSMEVPFVLDRVVVADRGAAVKVAPDAPAFSAPFEEFNTSEWWFEPVRTSLAEYLGVLTPSAKPVVTYISRQDDATRLKVEDHETLVKALRSMGKEQGYEIQVVSELGTSWQERMAAIARSRVVLGVHGQHMLDASFMAPAGSPTVMEFFPEGVFNAEQQVPIRALGMRYIAWWNNQKFSGTTLPKAGGSREDRNDVSIYAPAVVLAIREELGRRTV